MPLCIPAELVPGLGSDELSPLAQANAAIALSKALAAASPLPGRKPPPAGEAPARPAGRATDVSPDSRPDGDPGEVEEPVPELVWVAGQNGIPYPAHFTRTPGAKPDDWRGELRILGLGEHRKPAAARKPLRKALDWIAWFHPLPGTYDYILVSKAAHFSPAEMQAQHLRWITVHPGGPGSEGTPILVHDNGDSYTVVGGAGGSMNQMELKKKGQSPEEDQAGKAKAKELRDERVKAARDKDPEEFKRIESAKKEYAKAAKSALADLRSEALTKLGVNLDKVKADARDAAVMAATEANPNASPDQIADFVKKAEAGAVQDAHAQMDSVIRTALDAQARARINGDAPAAQDVSALVAGQQLKKSLTPEEVDALTTKAASVDSLQAVAKALQKALSTGNVDKARGIESVIEHLEPSPAEAKKLADDGFLERKSVKTQTSLVKGAKEASVGSQRSAQALGAADGLNAYASGLTGESVLAPEMARALGPEGAARVVASHLVGKGQDASTLAAGLSDRMREKSDEHAAAALTFGAELDAMTLQAKRAARTGDGTLTPAQALSIQAQNEGRKFQALNIARGQIQAAGYLRHHLLHPSDEPLDVLGGKTAIAADAKARSLGLDEGDYDVVPKGGQHLIQVHSDAIGKLAAPVSQETGERALAMAQIRQDAADGQDWRSPHQQPGVTLAPHQIAAARAITEQKRVVLNLAPGSGKTAVAMTAIDHLLSSGKIDRALISMPAKPRSQQADTEEKDANGKTVIDENGQPKRKPGEVRKFLSGEIADKVAVIESSADLKAKLADVDAGRAQVLIMSPEMMREQQSLLLQHGFGGAKSATIVDESHEIALGSHEQKSLDEDTGEKVEGSGKARAAEKLIRGSGYTALMSGSLIESDASELFGALNLTDENAFPRSGQRAFEQQWARTAQGGKAAIFGADAIGQVAARVNPYMMHYAAPVTTKDAATGQTRELVQEKKTETVPLTEDQNEQIRQANVQFKAEQESADPNVRKAAGLRRMARTQRAMIGPQTYDDMVSRIADRQGKDQSFRPVIWSQELGPIRTLKARIESENETRRKAGKPELGEVVTITGANSDQATQEAVAACNDPSRHVAAVIISNAGNFGVNLQGGHEVWKFGHPDVSSKDEQIDARVNRRGQTRDTVSRTFIGDHPLARQRLFQVRKVKGRSMAMLATLADDSGNSALLSQNLAVLHARADQSGKAPEPGKPAPSAPLGFGWASPVEKAVLGAKHNARLRKAVLDTLDAVLRKAAAPDGHDVTEEARDEKGRLTATGSHPSLVFAAKNATNHTAAAPHGEYRINRDSKARAAGRKPYTLIHADRAIGQFDTKAEAEGHAQGHHQGMMQVSAAGQGSVGALAGSGDPISHLPDLNHDYLRTLTPGQLDPTWAGDDKGLRCAYGSIILGPNGMILIRKPTNAYGGYAWSVVKGGQDPGEHPVDTALRETQEEAGFDGQVIGTLPGRFQGSGSVNRFFLMRSLGFDAAKIDHETEEVRWVTLDEAAELMGGNAPGTPAKRDFAILRQIAQTVPQLPGAAAAQSFEPPRPHFPYETEPPGWDAARQGEYTPDADPRNWPLGYNPEKHGPIDPARAMRYQAQGRTQGAVAGVPPDHLPSAGIAATAVKKPHVALPPPPSLRKPPGAPGAPGAHADAPQAASGPAPAPVASPAPAATSAPAASYPYNTPPAGYDAARSGPYDPAQDRRNWPAGFDPARNGTLDPVRSMSYQAQGRTQGALAGEKPDNAPAAGTTGQPGFYAAPASQQALALGMQDLTPEKRREIVDSFFTPRNPQMAAMLQAHRKPGARPRCVFLYGSPGAGKSTVSETLYLAHDAFVHVSSDAIKPLLPHYDHEHASEFHPLSMQVAEDVMARAKHEKRDFLLDSTGANMAWYQQQIEECKQKGYEVTFCHVKVSLPTALARNKARVAAGGRGVPDAIITRRHQQVQYSFAGLKHLADHVTEIDNE